MRHLKHILLIILGLSVAVAFLFFAMVNRETAILDLSPFPYNVEVRLFVLVGVLLLAGIVLGWFVASFECRKRYMLQKESRHRLKALEEENASLRSQLNRLEQDAALHTQHLPPPLSQS